MSTPVSISVVSPVYRAEFIICELVQRLETVLSGMGLPFEIILIEDGSPDNSWQKISEICTQKPFVKGISLSRNFGQHNAITAGLDNAKGEWVIVMDCDLQDVPEEIPNLYNKAQEGYDIVFARRAKRQDAFLKRISSNIFYIIFSYLSGVKQDGSIAQYGIYNRKVINAINSLREPMRSFSPMVRWVGFSTTAIDVVHNQRFEGKTSYNWSRLINLALDIIITYSDKPLKLIIKLGLSVTILSFLYTIFIVSKYLTGGIKVLGFTSLIVTICFFSGLILLTLGVLGLYISKIFDGIKNRPLYIVNKTLNK